ncbi:MAG: hydrogenase accessory protein HypB [Actinobacteria bacterium RBG_16_64_13]|nr:MAG: hydrogenase accessory protein HypB [Actinobacteria bacterium RBG_16_64_13]
MEIKVLHNILEANDRAADEVRATLAGAGATAFNFIGGPGSGKTSLLERVIPRVADRLRVGVLEGDIATTRDAERIAALGVPVVQLLTGGGCHLEAAFVARGLTEVGLSGLDLVLIENVGNIACPAEFDLGETAKVGVLSVTEGHDKPGKYPLLFHEVSALVLGKIDLLPYTDFDMQAFEADFRGLNAKAPFFPLSCRTGEGVAAFVVWMEQVHSRETDFGRGYGQQ